MSLCAARPHVCVLSSDKDKDSSGKMAETPATAAAAVQPAVCAVYEQRCPADCGTERGMGVRAGNIVERSRAACERSGRTRIPLHFLHPPQHLRTNSINHQCVIQQLLYIAV